MRGGGIINRQELKHLIIEVGLGHCWNAIEKTIKDDIQIVPVPGNETMLPLGMSKMGGHPDLPKRWNWPTDEEGIPLSFVAQISCKDAAIYDRQSILPRYGILYFFSVGDGEWENCGQYGYGKEDKNRFRVLFFDGDVSMLNRTSMPACDKRDEFCQARLIERKKFGRKPPDPQYYNSYQMTGVYPCCPLTFFVSCTPETYWQSPLRQNVLQEGEDDRYMQSLFPSQFLPCKLLGNPDSPEHDIEGFGHFVEDLDVNTPKSDWMLLFQVASSDVTKMVWGSCGTLFYIIRKQDLAEKCFDKTWAMIQW